MNMRHVTILGNAVRPIDVLGIILGVLTGGAGLWLLGFLEPSPCGSLSLYVDRGDRSPLYGAWLGFDCDRWPSLPESILLDWVPWLIVLALCGAVTVRLASSSASAWRGAVVAGLVAALLFAARTTANSVGYFGQSVSARYLVIGAAICALAAVAGYIGGRLVRKTPIQREPPG